MEKQYVLDLTKAELPSWWTKSDPVILPVVKSKYQYDWDLIPEELPAPFYAKLVEIISKNMKDKGQASSTNMPIGFLNNALPDGAVVRLV
ncbi:MAG: hypothetical protein PHH28_17100 [Desulfuromonadaceae bacterium]|nr:hypothetical protein [Desulfuromonadaceae bacterium]